MLRLFLLTFLAVFNGFVLNSFADEATTAAAQPQSGLVSLVPLILILLVFYFLLIRPQQKKFKEHQNTLDHLKVGDKVFTTGGLVGVVKAVDKKNPEIDLEIANQVVVKIIKTSVADVVKEKKHKEKTDNKN